MSSEVRRFLSRVQLGSVQGKVGMDVKGYSADVKGCSVDVKDYSVDVKGSSTDVKDTHT